MHSNSNALCFNRKNQKDIHFIINTDKHILKIKQNIQAEGVKLSNQIKKKLYENKGSNGDIDFNNIIKREIFTYLMFLKHDDLRQLYKKLISTGKYNTELQYYEYYVRKYFSNQTSNNDLLNYKNDIINHPLTKYFYYEFNLVFIIIYDIVNF